MRNVHCGHSGFLRQLRLRHLFLLADFTQPLPESRQVRAHGFCFVVLLCSPFGATPLPLHFAQRSYRGARIPFHGVPSAFFGLSTLKP
jgi:hypothetical protein